MPKINVDGQEYDVDSLPEAARLQLQSMQFVDAELARLSAQTAVFKTARIGYANALKQALLPQQPAPAAPPAPSPSTLDSGTIQFG